MINDCAYPLLLTITGVDQPGITASLTAVLARKKISILDIEQVVVHRQLTLCLLIDLDINNEANEDILKDLLFVAKTKQQNLEYRIIKEDNSFVSDKHPRRYAITVMGSPVSTFAINQLSTILASHNANIASIRRLCNDNTLSSLEVSVTIEASAEEIIRLKADLMLELSKSEVDIALQRESLVRRNKRLAVLDMDSTLIQIEVIDELAKYHGVEKAVSEITNAAMNGQFDFSQSLKKRVALLKGLPEEKLLELANRLPLANGAVELITVLKGLGYKVGIISGGFHMAADTLMNKLGLDFAYANRLETVDGFLTGKVIKPIVDAEKKADLLEWIAHKEKIPLEQTIAIGDGANDALMLSKAGLGIAYYAKHILRKTASTTVSSGGMERIFYLLGMNALDINEFLRRSS